MSTQKPKGVFIPLEDYVEILEARRQQIEEWWGWTIPDLVWETYLEFLEECGGETGCRDMSPSYVVDNIAINGSYGDFDEYKKKGESDEEFIARVEDDCLRIFPEERFVIFSI